MKIDMFSTIVYIVIAALALGFGGWYAFLGAVLGMPLGIISAYYVFHRKRKRPGRTKIE